MANSSREIRRRIKSVKNIAQITKAMELVSAAKMRKAQAAALASRPYAQVSGELLRRLAVQTEITAHPLINRIVEVDPPHRDGGGKTLVILISSDRGLAGALNANLAKKALEIIQAEGAVQVELMTFGKKAADAGRRMGRNLIAAFPGKDKNLSILDAKPIADIAINDFLKFRYEKVFVVYTNFISTLNQKPNVLQLLPFVSHGTWNMEHGTEQLFEPSAGEVLDKLVYRTVEFAVYQCLVEAVASEHSARMLAMRNANDAASELIDDLSLSYNQARQAGITKELSEISAAKLAME